MLHCLLAGKVLAVPVTSAAPERMFSVAGNIMTKKRARYNHLKELMYLGLAESERVSVTEMRPPRVSVT